MSLTIELSPQEEQRLREEAARQGLPPEELVLQAVKQLIPSDSNDIEARLARLDRILLDPDDAEDQRETWEFLKKALDEDRLSYRKLFP